MRNNDLPLVSLVVPAFNEEAIILKNLERLCEFMVTLEDRYRWELVIVNDGSTDNTGAIAEDFMRNRDNVFVLHHMYNFRLGQALRYAFNCCRGDIIVVMDIDLSYSPEHIARMLTKMQATRAKIVIASPYMEGGCVSNVPWIRKFLSRWANWFLGLMVKRDRYSDKLTTITGMVRAYDGVFLRRLNLKAMDYDINLEIIYKAKILRARIVEIPAHLNWEHLNVPKAAIKLRKSSLRIMASILQSFLFGFLFRPFRFFILPGITLLALSLYPLFWTFIHTVKYFRQFGDVGGSIDHRISVAIGAAFDQAPHAFIVGGVVLLVAIQMVSLGFLALQKKRYFEELFYLGSSIYRQTDNREKIETL
jgi:glycosyltransferase involved in cell wall biosynthesis